MRRLFGFILAFCVLLMCSCTNIPSSSVYVHILDVGKADCIVIESGDQVIMIDTAEEENIPEIFAFLDRNKISQIDCLILSHFDKDHIGGAKKLIEQYSVLQVIESSFSSTRSEYIAYHQEMKEKGLVPMVLEEDFTLSFGECNFSVTVPQKKSYPRKEDNNASLIVEMTHQNNHLLFCGDAQEERLQEWIDSNDSEYSFIKMPHHGSNLDNLNLLIQSAKPKYAAITCSEKNPADIDTLTLLKESKVSVYQTRFGNITVSSDGNDLIIKQ